MKIERFNSAHLDNFSPREYEKSFYEYYGTWQNALLTMTQSSESFSVISKGETLAIGGIARIMGDTHEIWMCPTEKENLKGMDFARTIRELVDFMCEGKRRVQSHCENDDLHSRWMKFVNFEKEGVLKSYGPHGEDYAIFGRVNE